jgi:hypothetical protein
VPSGVISTASDTAQQRVAVLSSHAVAQATFSHPDYTVGSGVSPDLLNQLAGLDPVHTSGIHTADRELTNTNFGLTLPRRLVFNWHNSPDLEPQRL